MEGRNGRERVKREEEKYSERQVVDEDENGWEEGESE